MRVKKQRLPSVAFFSSLLENCSATGNARVTKMAVLALDVGKVSNVALLNFCLSFRKAETVSTDHFSFFYCF